MKYNFEEYCEILEGAGWKLKEIVLDRAANDEGIDLRQLKALIEIAYPEE